ncbi:MAG: hypothetical protein ACRD2Z_06295 [Thermoanaerobaculia bacterium]
MNFDQKVDLFYEQALGWQLHLAELVANGGTAFGEEGNREGKVVSSIRHSGFAVLQICLSYFETIGYYTGEQSGTSLPGVGEESAKWARRGPAWCGKQPRAYIAASSATRPERRPRQRGGTLFIPQATDRAHQRVH